MLLDDAVAPWLTQPSGQVAQPAEAGESDSLRDAVNRLVDSKELSDRE